MLPSPLPHGAVGPWDEILNLAPLVVGAGLLIYLYFTSRKRRAAESAARQSKSEPPESGPSAESGPQP